MKTFNKEVKTEVYVSISDEDKIKKGYLESGWEDCFWKLGSVDGFVESLIHMLHIHPVLQEKDSYNEYKHPEGFPRFEKPNVFDEKYIHESDELGKIVVVFGETTVDDEW